MALSIVGSCVVVVGLMQPPGGWSVLGTIVQVQLPGGLETGMDTDTFKVCHAGIRRMWLSSWRNTMRNGRQPDRF